MPKKQNRRILFKLGLIFIVPATFLLVFCWAEAENKEDKKEEIRKELKEIEEDLGEKEEEELTLSGQLKKIEANISETEKEISQTNDLIEGFQEDINEKQKKINLMARKIKKQKENLAQALRQFNRSYEEMELFFMSSQNDIGKYFNYLEQIEQVQVELEKMIRGMEAEKNLLNNEKEIVENKKRQEYKALSLQKEQEKALKSQEVRKQFYLEKTQEKIDLLNIKREDLRRQLNALQSLGKPIDLEEAIEAAEYASDETGVRAEFLLGVLRVESNMGQNVGGGTYKKDMNPTQRDIFEDICDDLGYKAKKMPVSKRICYDPDAKDGCGGWGGAMGPAQFMPSTWLGYKDRVEKVTGHDPPDPWDLEDAMIAMGLKLAAVDGVTKHKESAERQAAAMYLAGGAWENYLWYGDRVLQYADMFKKYIEED